MARISFVLIFLPSPPCTHIPQHPLEIENCLLAHSAVQEVSCVGIKDERYGEVVAAFVRPHEDRVDVDTDELREWVRKRLSNHLGIFFPFDRWYWPVLTEKVPKYVFVGRDQFPKTASGKIQKFKLQEMGEVLIKGMPSSRVAAVKKEVAN